MDIHPPGSRRPAAGRRIKPTTNTAPASQGGGFLHGQPPEQKKKQARSSHPAAVPGGKTPRPPVRFPARVRPLRRAVCFLAPFPASQGRGRARTTARTEGKAGASRSRLRQGNAPLPANVPAPPPGPFSRLIPRFAQGVGFARTSPPNREAPPRRSHSPPLRTPSRRHLAHFIVFSHIRAPIVL